MFKSRKLKRSLRVYQYCKPCHIRSIPNDSLTLYVDAQIDLENQGQRDGVPTSRSRDPYNDGNHDNPHGVSIGNVNFGSSTNATFIGCQHGINLNASKK